MKGWEMRVVGVKVAVKSEIEDEVIMKGAGR